MTTLETAEAVGVVTLDQECEESKSWVVQPGKPPELD